MENNKSPKLLFAMSMAIFGTLGIFTRNIAMPSQEIAIYRAVFASLLILAYLLFKGEKIKPTKSKRELVLLILSGIATALSWIFLFEAYNNTSISVATLSYYFSTVIVMVISPILFREKLTAKQIVCFLMSTLGLVLIIGIDNLSGTGRDIAGVFFGILGAVFYAAVVVLNKSIKNVEGVHRTLFQLIVVAILMGPYVIYTKSYTILELDSIGWMCLLIVGLFHTGITYCMYFSALKDMRGQDVAILSYIDPLVAVLVSVMIFGEHIGAMQLVGGALILGFTFWNEKSK